LISRSVGAYTVNWSAKFRHVVILKFICSGWIHFSKRSEFAGPLQSEGSFFGGAASQPTYTKDSSTYTSAPVHSEFNQGIKMATGGNCWVGAKIIDNGMEV
jgi:hypothetical protein